MNRKAVLGFALAAFLALFALPAHAANATPSGLPVILAGVRVSQATNYEPFPVEPGESFDFWVRLDNSATAIYNAITGIECQVEQKYPFSSADPQDNLARFVGTLGPTQVALLKFKLRVDEKAVSGANGLPFRCRSSSNDWASVDLAVQVQARDPVLVVERVESKPSEFTPGSSGLLSFTLENKAAVVLRNVQLTLDLSSSSLPLSPEKSSGSAYLERILGGETSTVAFNLLASPSAEPGVYKIPVKLSYQDELGTKYSRDLSVAVVVYSQPDILLSVERADVLKPNSKGSVVVSVTNRGLSDVKRLTAVFKNAGGFQILSAPTIYLGDIDRDDFETIEVELFVNSQGGELRLPMQYSYLDAFNRPVESEGFVTARVYSQAEVAALQLEQAAGGLNMLVIAMVVLVAAYLAYRWYRGRRR